MGLADVLNLAAAVFPTAVVENTRVGILVSEGGYTWYLDRNTGTLHPWDKETRAAGLEAVPARFFPYAGSTAQYSSSGEPLYYSAGRAGKEEFYAAWMVDRGSNQVTVENYAARLSNQAGIREFLPRITGTSEEDWKLRNPSKSQIVYRAARSSDDSELTVEFDWFYTKPSKTSILLDARLSTGPDFEECLRYARRLRDMALLIERTLNPAED